jgi:hypothetical protein
MAVHVADFGQSCLGCHDGVDRYSHERFDHNALAFRLQGKHAEVGCGECHAGATTVAGLQGAKGACVDCHQDDDAHQGQFGTGCADCHNTTSWPDAEFDHSKTAFSLAGKHAGVECQDCHKDGSFVGTSAQCVSCHADPIFHQGAFGTACADCHTDTGWQPATFNQRHTFPIDHGEDGAASCRTCHPDNVQAYTCYGCHEHSPAEMIEKHAEEVPGDISNCIECHPTGQKEEGGRD